MLQLFRKYQKAFSLCTLVVFGLTFMPTTPSYALSSGPSQPETQQFAPAGMDNMVDPFTGDFSYNIPLMDVGGYPINLNYAAGITPDAEASWCGLGWNVNVGAINRSMRGLPDDFKGEEVAQTYHVKPNQTFTLNFAWKNEMYGFDMKKVLKSPSKNIAVSYNTYNGFSASFGVSPLKAVKLFSIGPFNTSITDFSLGSEEGLGFTPKFSFAYKKQAADKDATYETGLSFPYNTREGIKGMSFTHSAPSSQASLGKLGIKPNLGGAFFGFSTPSHTPSISHEAYNVNIDLGLSLAMNINVAKEFTSYDIKGYYAGQFLKQNQVGKQAYGYLYTGIDNSSTVLMDFNREKDGSYDKNTKNLALTHFTYDVFSATGQGVGGAYRLFRSDVGTINDPETSEDGYSPSVGVDLEFGSAPIPTMKLGVDLKYYQSSSTSGKWGDDAIPVFQSPINTNQNKELIYFKKIGEMGIETDANTAFYDKQLYNTDLVKPSIATILGDLKGNVFSPSNRTDYLLKNTATRPERVPRNENLTFLTAEEASSNAISPQIKTFEFNTFTWPLASATSNHNVLSLTDQFYKGHKFMDRIDAAKKPHHISEIRLTQAGGSRYVYGIPVYNTEHYEATFSVNPVGDTKTGLVPYTTEDNSVANAKGLEHFYAKTNTPAYAISYLLTNVFSADYVDADNIKGPSDGDLGNYTNFNYAKLNDNYHWRTPIAAKAYYASYNEGLQSRHNDDKGSIVYGTKEIYYVHSIETRTHVAEFYTEDRLDGLGVMDENGAVGGVKQKCLKKIVLYAKADKRNGISIPVKTVYFDYTYELSPGSPNSKAPAVTGAKGYKAGGKLTLKRVWFTYGNSQKGALNPYEFEYPTGTLNPEYAYKDYDRWGNFKKDIKKDVYENEMSNAAFPYTPQIKTKADEYASVYNLKSILTPTGGKIHVFYESDDYAYVQNKQAMRMFKVADSDKGELYGAHADITGGSTKIKIDLGEGFTVEAMKSAGYTDADEFFRAKYLADLPQIYFNFNVNVYKSDFDHFENVSGYADLQFNDCTVLPAVNGVYKIGKIAFKNKKFGNFVTGNDVNDMVKNSWMFAKMNLNQVLMGGKDASDFEVDQVIGAITEAVARVVQTLVGFPNYMTANNHGKFFNKNKSFVRLKEFDFIKIGGGHRVKAVVMEDQWKKMTASPNEVGAYYGQYYSYTKLQNEQTISSGVAIYEPMLGGEENPFKNPLYKQEDNNWFKPVKESYIDGPYGESFFPGAGIGYSKVTVTPIQLNALAGVNTPISNGTGAVIQEFYTAKDFPTAVNQTGLESRNMNLPAIDIFMMNFKVELATCSQGYSIELNDMHGKQKSQMVIPASLSKTTPSQYALSTEEDAISKVVYTYKTNKNGQLINHVTVIDKDLTIETNKEMGIHVDVVHDQRYHDYTSAGAGLEMNLKFMLFGFIPVLAPTAWPDFKYEYNRFKSLVTTKVINRSGILDTMKATDNGSTISTTTLAYDKITGQPLLTSTINEFEDPIYNFTYPAHWGYDRMKMASINEGMVFSNPNAAAVKSKLVDGDELSILSSENNGHNGTLTGKYIVRIDPKTADLKLVNYYNGSETKFLLPYTAKIIRSGYKNMHETPIGSISTKTNPIKNGHRSTLVFENVLKAVATEFKDVWKYFCNCPYDTDPTIDPYIKGYAGLMRPWRSHTYLSGRTQDKNNNQLNIRKDGVFTGTFVPFWMKKDQFTGLSACAKTSSFIPADTKGNLSSITTSLAYVCSPWQYVTEITNYNSMGMEIENKDALGRYAMAQFGYGRHLPVATANNSQYQESAFDGFEDYDYNDCRDDHFSWRSVNRFVPTAVVEAEAHTGSKSYKVPHNTKVPLSKTVSSPCVEEVK